MNHKIPWTFRFILRKLNPENYDFDNYDIMLVKVGNHLSQRLWMSSVCGTLSSLTLSISISFECSPRRISDRVLTTAATTRTINAMVRITIMIVKVLVEVVTLIAEFWSYFLFKYREEFLPCSSSAQLTLPLKNSWLGIDIFVQKLFSP